MLCDKEMVKEEKELVELDKGCCKWYVMED